MCDQAEKGTMNKGLAPYFTSFALGKIPFHVQGEDSMVGARCHRLLGELSKNKLQSRVSKLKPENAD